MSLTLATFLAVLPISQITAQGAAQRASTLADSSAVSIMAHVTPRGDPSWFLDIMQQRHRAVSESKLDALADSLVARAMQGLDRRRPSKSTVAWFSYPRISLPWLEIAVLARVPHTAGPSND